MTNSELDEILGKSAPPDSPDRAVIDRVRRIVLATPRPVKQIAPAWVWMAILIFVVLLVAAAGAFAGGVAGLIKLDAPRRIVIFALLAAGLLVTILAAVKEMTPAVKRCLHPRTIAVLSIVVLVAAFALLFQDYRAVRAALGMSCFRLGLLGSAITAILAWAMLMRGFVIDRAAAGIATGTLAGLSGLTVLEIHCPIFTAPHILVWHVAVLVVSAAAGALGGLLWRKTAG